jgi:hypothetical protein
VTRRVGERRVPSGARVQAVAACRARETAVAASHAVAFRTSAPPSRAQIAAVTAAHRLASSRAVATASATHGLPGDVRALVQVIAHCRKDVP